MYIIAIDLFFPPQLMRLQSGSLDCVYNSASVTVIIIEIRRHPDHKETKIYKLR